MFKLIPRVRVNYTLLDLLHALLTSEKSYSFRLECEKLLSNLYDGLSVVLVPSGRDALYEILIRLPQKKVVIPVYNCLAVLEAVKLAGKEPVFSRLKDNSYNATYIESITADCIVIATHQYGIPCDIKEIAAKCFVTGAVLIEDCATSMGTLFEGIKTGLFGHYSILSFNVSKLLNVPNSGGAVISRDAIFIADIKKNSGWKNPNLFLKIKGLMRGLVFVILKNCYLYRLFHYWSLERKDLLRRKGHDAIANHKTCYYNYSFSEWQGSILLRQLKTYDNIIRKRKDIYKKYDAQIISPYLHKPIMDNNAVCCRYAMQVFDRERFYKKCLRNGVDLDFSHSFIECGENYLYERQVANQVTNIPFYFNLTKREMDRVVNVVNQIHVLILEGYCKQCLPFIRGFKELGCEVTVLCGSRLDCCYSSHLPDHKILGICDMHRPKESEDYIVSLVKTGQYDIVFPPFDFSSRIMAHHKRELSSFARISVNNADVFDVASDKMRVMSICDEEKIPIPKTFFHVKLLEDLDKIDYPIIIKPRSLYGARGFHIFSSPIEFKSYVKVHQIQLSDYVIQEQIPQGSGLVTGNLFIDRNGDVKSAYLYKSEHFYPIEGGTSTLNGIINRPDALESCKRLAKVLNLRGLVGIDMMLDKRDNIVKVIEVNPRPVHGVTLGFVSGINHALQILEDSLGRHVTDMKISRTDTCVRILQTDILWWLFSPNRFKLTPRKLGYRFVKEQMFFWDDPFPWFSFLLSGIKEFRMKMKEKRN